MNEFAVSTVNISECNCLYAVVKQFQEYVEPGSDLEAVPQRRNPESEEESVLLPLGDNTLTHNLGLPIVVVCTKVHLRLLFKRAATMAPAFTHHLFNSLGSFTFF